MGKRPSLVLEKTSERESKTDRPWKVILWDDDSHTYDYVIEMLVDVCFMTNEQAFQHAVEVDTLKQTIVFTGEYEHAEHIQERILQYGPDFRMDNSKGSMTATIEKL